MLARKSFFGLLFTKLQSFLEVESDNPIIARLTKRIAVFSVAFLLVSSFIPLYQYTEGYQAEGDYGVMEYTEFETDSVLAEMMTEDGFLLKPALNSAQGDRSTANEIFAYEVESGDTLSSIAQRFGISKETLVMENELWNINSLRSGMTLNILPVDGISHLVKKGDTVEKVAKKYSIEADTIITQNQLEEGDELLAGVALIIPGAKKAMPVYTASTAPSSASYAYTGPKTGRLIWPTLAKSGVTQGFRAGHYALDIANRGKGPIFAAASGKVVRADYGWSGGYGNVVIIDHGNGMQTLYAHNEKLYVTAGQYVEQGQTIAWMGNTGRVYGATGIHLHFEVRINGVKYNPMNFF
ncbi:M23 family metallopeptidase [Patescibacteria group bacterium]|nr:M23 family metallopeptidase [Patescibacteria group bacterium]